MTALFHVLIHHEMELCSNMIAQVKRRGKLYSQLEEGVQPTKEVSVEA